ncbi:MAG: YkgJ family cysteine cluster protein [Thermoleophilia bacterium]
MSERKELPAGDFSAWLRAARHALAVEEGTDVNCTGCDACCSSSYFIHIRPEETRTIGRIHEDLLAAAPGLPTGHVVLGYDTDGRCPMLEGGGMCSIYECRPLTCRAYDCRVFAAAGIEAGGADKARITERARRWEFAYPTQRDRDEHAAVQAAATFIREHAESFPGGAIPRDPSQLAIVAIKVYGVLLGDEGRPGSTAGRATDEEVAAAIVQASREFDAGRG